MTTPNIQPSIRIGSALSLKIAPEEAERGLITGYGATFDQEPDRHGDVVFPGAFAKSLQDRLPAMVWAHDLTRPIGRWTEAVEDSRGLFLKGYLNLDTDAGQQAHSHVKAGDVTGLSMGYLVPSGGSSFDQRTGVRSLRVVDLYEVSPVSVPSMKNARITEVKSIGSQRELQALLHDGGLPRAAAAKVATAGWRALNAREDVSPEISTLAQRIHAATAEIRKMKG